MSHDADNQWREEANAVIADIRDHVDYIDISPVLPSSSKKIYMNLTTLEKSHFCIELTALGFRIVGNKFDSADDETARVFETPYSLLESISPRYRESFGQQLVNKLTRLQRDMDSGS